MKKKLKEYETSTTTDRNRLLKKEIYVDLDIHVQLHAAKPHHLKLSVF